LLFPRPDAAGGCLFWALADTGIPPPPPVRQIPPVRGAALIVWSARKNSKARAARRRRVSTPALPPPHRGGKKTRQVCGLFIGLREHDLQAHIIWQAFDPDDAGGRERGTRGPPGSWRRTTNRLRTPAAKE